MGTQERKQRELAVRKEMIIERSKALFFSRGFHNVSIQDICKAVEYGKSAVYGIFESKEEIYGYVYVEAVKILADLLHEIDCSTADPASALLLAVKQIYRFYSEYTPYYTALFFFDSNHVACDKIPAYLMALKKQEGERALIPGRTLLTRGIEEKVFREFDPDEIMPLFFSSLLGIINSFLAENREADNPGILYKKLIEHAEIYTCGLKR